MKRLFILLSISFLAGIIIAQEVQTMYIMRSDAVTHQIPISEIDSVVFQTPVTAPVIAVSDVTLNLSAVTLTLGSSETLIPTVLPTNASNRSVSWRSSNTAVATVNVNGVVNALSMGTTTITVTTADGGHTATSDITVVPIRVTGVMLNRNATTITIGSSETLTATLIPVNATNQNLMWTSSNPSVASVDAQGRINTISAGETTVTVTTHDGAHTATCIVTVVPIFVTGITLNRNTVELFVGGTTQLIATVTPANATNRNVTWNSNNTSVATVNGYGQVTAVGAGTATILATTECGARTAGSTITVSEDTGVLIGGVRWATRNVETPGVFAEFPESLGGHFNWNNRNVCPQGWRVPTLDEIQSLNNSGHMWITKNGVNGRLFGISPNQIFLPAAGMRHTNITAPISHLGTQGHYWTDTQTPNNFARTLNLTINGSSALNESIVHHLSIRCVKVAE